MVKILLVDDEERMLRLLDLFLSPRGYFCMKATSGLEALKLIEQKEFDIILLDVMMPSMDGWDTCYQIRQISNVPIIMLTARNQNYDMVKGLTMGADDYITKPFDEHVLVARIEAILRRTKKMALLVSMVLSGIKRNILSQFMMKNLINSYRIFVTRTILQNTNRAYSRDDLIEKIWGYETDIEYRTIDSHIRNIRDKLRKKDFRLKIT